MPQLQWATKFLNKLKCPYINSTKRREEKQKQKEREKKNLLLTVTCRRFGHSARTRFFQTCSFGSAWQLGLVESTHLVLRRLLLMGQAQTGLEGFNYSILHWRLIGGG